MSRIHFAAVEPDFTDRGTGFYSATVDDVPIRAGITNEAWVHLQPSGRDLDCAPDDVDHPVHRITQNLIQSKFDMVGRDRSGAVVITLMDLDLSIGVQKGPPIGVQKGPL